MAENLRIAFFAPSFLPKCSGAEIFHHNLATRLVERGHQVSVVLPKRYLSELASVAGKSRLRAGSVSGQHVELLQAISALCAIDESACARTSSAPLSI